MFLCSIRRYDALFWFLEPREDTLLIIYYRQYCAFIYLLSLVFAEEMAFEYVK